MRYSKIEQECLTILKDKAKKIGKDLGWFKFAKKKRNGGWIFLEKREAQFRVLTELASRLAKKHTKYKSGELVDKLSQLVNQ